MFAGALFLSVFLEREVRLRTELDMEFGLADGKKGKGVEKSNANEVTKVVEARC